MKIKRKEKLSKSERDQQDVEQFIEFECDESESEENSDDDHSTGTSDDEDTDATKVINAFEEAKNEKDALKKGLHVIAEIDEDIIAEIGKNPFDMNFSDRTVAELIRKVPWSKNFPINGTPRWPEELEEIADDGIYPPKANFARDYKQKQRIINDGKRKQKSRRIRDDRRQKLLQDIALAGVRHLVILRQRHRLITATLRKLMKKSSSILSENEKASLTATMAAGEKIETQFKDAIKLQKVALSKATKERKFIWLKNAKGLMEMNSTVLRLPCVKATDDGKYWMLDHNELDKAMERKASSAENRKIIRSSGNSSFSYGNSRFFRGGRRGSRYYDGRSHQNFGRSYQHHSKRNWSNRQEKINNTNNDMD